MELNIISLVLLAVVGAISGQECPFLIIQQCIQDVDIKINNLASDPQELCKDDATYFNDLETCTITTEIVCSGQQAADLLSQKQAVQDQLETLCEGVTQAPPPTTTPTPPIECTNENWTPFNYRLQSCKDIWGTLDELKVNDKLTKYAICRSVQSKLDCMYAIPGISQCTMFKDATNREAIDEIKFAHLFGCDVTIDGVKLTPDKSNVCDFWSWVGCHDSLLTAIGLDKVSASTNLDDIINFKVSEVTLGIANEQKSCSQFKGVDFTAIKQCRAKMADKCDVILHPRRDALWGGVLELMYGISTGVANTLFDMLRLEAICASGCTKIMERINTYRTCKIGKEDLLTQITMKFATGENLDGVCNQLETVTNCFFGPDAIGSCDFVKSYVVTDTHGDTRWKLAMDICQLDLDLQATPGCQAERELEGYVITRCSPQTRPNLRDALLDATQRDVDFCRLLQTSVNCYVQYVSLCPRLEKQYWAGDVATVHAANQMIGECAVMYETAGNVPVSAVTECDMTRWVGCMAPLWTALGVNVKENTLDTAGFRALLKLAWNVPEERQDRCGKVKDLNFGNMERCVEGLNMDCKFPMLTFHDGNDYKSETIDPFDVSALKTLVEKACTTGCTDSTLNSELQKCLDSKGDSSIIQTYPLDIIFNGYLNRRDNLKCRSLEDIDGCINYAQRNCDHEDFNILKTASVLEAKAVCDRRGNPTTTPTTGGAKRMTGGVALLVVLSLMHLVKMVPEFL